MAVPSTDKPAARRHSWEPQDLTQDRPGCVPIPDDDYVKQYQRNPALWPVEFFLIVYRRTRNAATQKLETSVLVRKSANGTSKWGVGTGVPATRWMYVTRQVYLALDAGHLAFFSAGLLSPPSRRLALHARRRDGADLDQL